MKKNAHPFEQKNLENIKNIFERETGVTLSNRRERVKHHRLMAALLAAALCLTAALPVLAAGVPAIYELMYLVSPQVAQFFKPVQKSDESAGIRMEVVSAHVQDNTAEIYVTLQDLTADRVDGTTDLFDSYSINRPFDSAASCRLVGYDDQTRTATFLIGVTEWGNEKIAGQKITFSFRRFLSHKSSYRDHEIPIDLFVTAGESDLWQVFSNGGGGEHYPSGEDTLTALVPTPPLSAFNVDGLELTAVGYIDGQLHIQFANRDPLANDNHAFLYLKDEQGNQLLSDYNFYFSNEYGAPTERIDYCEYVFAVPQGEIAQYTLAGDFSISGLLTEGYWSVTFPLEQGE